MIVYTVELEMDATLREAYLPWLRGHVAEMLTLPGFVSAEILVRTDPPPTEGRCVFCTHYRLRDRSAFQHYVAHDAARMRAASAARFGDRVRSARQLLETA